MVTDCHAHLDSPSMKGFLESLGNRIVTVAASDSSGERQDNFRIISNSTDIASSQRNIELGRKFPGWIIPFVGIHPQSVMQIALSTSPENTLNEQSQKLSLLVPRSAGIGEIGLDSKYGYEDIQLKIFLKQLEICESLSRFPIAIHSRNSVNQVLEMLSSFDLSENVLFHWFSGTATELVRIQSTGYYVSFGPSLLYSKRIQGLAKSADSRRILAETDSPLYLSEMSGGEPLTPFAVTSVLFKLAEIRRLSFQSIVTGIEENSNEYLQAQNSLRVSGKQSLYTHREI